MYQHLNVGKFNKKSNILNKKLRKSYFVKNFSRIILRTMIKNIDGVD